ncbi:hypothetical protein JL09_g5846 [Pichia kudriavzevii]|uniref:Uncharacterized protein n=1 Tax=Pichia kudriavzevii TaxID=4909 RepID=A0A099NR38_PICKU|nr:hypothetical protein JL09_g5846 [Pichia kudriavzevii]
MTTDFLYAHCVLTAIDKIND